MNFHLALKAMQDGKKVRRPCFALNNPPLGHVRIDIRVDDGQRSFIGHYIDACQNERFELRVCVDLEDVEATDWEVVEET